MKAYVITGIILQIIIPPLLIGIWFKMFPVYGLGEIILLILAVTVVSVFNWIKCYRCIISEKDISVRPN
jgi:hypothetical protein